MYRRRQLTEEDKIQVIKYYESSLSINEMSTGINVQRKSIEEFLISEKLTNRKFKYFKTEEVSKI